MSPESHFVRYFESLESKLRQIGMRAGGRVRVRVIKREATPPKPRPLALPSRKAPIPHIEPGSVTAWLRDHDVDLLRVELPKVECEYRTKKMLPVLIEALCVVASRSSGAGARRRQFAKFHLRRIERSMPITTDQVQPNSDNCSQSVGATVGAT